MKNSTNQVWSATLKHEMSINNQAHIIIPIIVYDNNV